MSGETRLARSAGIGAAIVIVAACAFAQAVTVTHYEYANHGQATRVYVQDGEGTEAPFLAYTVTTYDENGRQESVRRRAAAGTDDDAADEVTLYYYTWSGQLGKVERKGPSADAITLNEYDNIGRLTKVTAPQSQETRYQYDASGNVTRQDVENGATDLVTLTEYDALNRATKVTDPDSHYRLNTYDSRGNLIGQKAYNSLGTLMAKQAWSYDKAGRLTMTARFKVPGEDLQTPAPATDEVAEYVYDADGRVLTTETYNMGNGTTPLATVNEYDGIGRLTKTTDPLGYWTLSAYDTRGLVTQRTVEDGYSYERNFDYVYDTLGRLTSETAFGGGQSGTILVSTYAYDALDRRTSVTDPENKRTDYRYNLLGRQVRMTEDATGLARATDSIYDRLGRLIGLVAYDGTAPADPPGDLVTAHGISGAQLTRYDYDLADRRTRIAYPDSQYPDPGTDAVTFVYDLAGRMTSKTDQREIATAYAYNGRGLLLSKTVASLNDLVQYAYDGLGRMTLAKRGTSADDDAVSSSTFGYDALSRLTSEAQSVLNGNARTVTYEYDQAGNRTKMTHPGSSVVLTYSFDNLNRVTQIQRGSAALLNYVYAGLYLDSRSIRTAAAAQTWINTSYGWDEHRRNSSIVNQSRIGPQPYLYPRGSALFQFDKVGNRTLGHLDPGPAGSLTYGYDGLHRLTSVQYGSHGQETFQYDLLGNRSNYTDTRTGGSSVPYGPNNAVNEYPWIKTDAKSLTYDAAGNLTQDETNMKYEYDHENRLVKIKRAD